MNAIVTTEENVPEERRKIRRFGDAACVSGCLSLRSGFALICCWALAWAVGLLVLTESIWKVLYYTDWAIYLGEYFNLHSGDKGRIKQLVTDFEYWTWWGTWIDGLLLLFVAITGFWGLWGCCLGTHMKRARQLGLILTSCWLASVQWLLGCGVVVGFPIWLKVKRNVSLFSWKLGLCYSFFFALPVFCGGFWLCDAVFSYYFVLRIGGTGLELKNASEIRRQKQRQVDDLIDDLEELSERRPLIDNLCASDFAPPLHHHDDMFGKPAVVAVGRVKDRPHEP